MNLKVYNCYFLLQLIS